METSIRGDCSCGPVGLALWVVVTGREQRPGIGNRKSWDSDTLVEQEPSIQMSLPPHGTGWEGRKGREDSHGHSCWPQRLRNAMAGQRSWSRSGGAIGWQETRKVGIKAREKKERSENRNGNGNGNGGIAAEKRGYRGCDAAGRMQGKKEAILEGLDMDGLSALPYLRSVLVSRAAIGRDYWVHLTLLTGCEVHRIVLSVPGILSNRTRNVSCLRGSSSFAPARVLIAPS